MRGVIAGQPERLIASPGGDDDVAGVAVALTGMGLIMFQPR